jgi:hypothetical protein
MAVMTTAIVVSSTQELAVAAAAIRSGLAPLTKASILVVSVAPAAELDHSLLDAAIALTQDDDIPVVHLNAIVHPRHPLGLRLADLSADEFTEKWNQLGGPQTIDRIVSVGRKKRAWVNTLRTVLGAEPARIAYSPEHAAATLRRNQALVVDAPTGFTTLVRVLGGRIQVVPSRELEAARSVLETFDPEVRAVPWKTTVPRWWFRLLRSFVRNLRDTTTPKPTPKKRPAPPANVEQRAQESINFTREMIERLDAAAEKAPGRSS